MILIQKDGTKLYPVANWNEHQHIFYNYVDRCAIAYYEDPTDKNYDEWQEAQEILMKFDRNPRKRGIVYADYDTYCKMKDIIGGYLIRHDALAALHIRDIKHEKGAIWTLTI